MKSFFTIFLTMALLSCQNSSPFKNVACQENEQSYRVFKPCRQYIYNAKLWDTEFNLISENKIWMMATGKPWDMQPDRQAEIVIQHEFDSGNIGLINEKNINKSLELSWVHETTTGIIENDNEVWMHPFRQNQYTFTEVAPFPQVYTPLKIGNEWNNTLNIEGWGDWKNTALKNFYEVVSYEAIELPYKKLDAWRVNSYSEAPFGNSTHNFWFHPELGFVKMIIKNYGGQTLQIELIEVIEG